MTLKGQARHLGPDFAASGAGWVSAPPQMGTQIHCSFAPPLEQRDGKLPPTVHCMLGYAEGKRAVQEVLP